MVYLDEIRKHARAIWSCEKCRKLGINRNPSKGIIPLFAEGNPNVKIWFVGLNPKLDADKGIRDKETASDFNKYFSSCVNYDFNHRYFKVFKNLFSNLGFKLGNEVLSNDLVKCGSKDWNITNKEEIIKNCSNWLWEQIELMKPRFILCNGVAVSKAIYEKYTGERFDPTNVRITRIKFVVNNGSCTAFLSGFVSQIDKFARVRLLREIRENINK